MNTKGIDSLVKITKSLTAVLKSQLVKLCPKIEYVKFSMKKSPLQIGRGETSLLIDRDRTCACLNLTL